MNNFIYCIVYYEFLKISPISSPVPKYRGVGSNKSCMAINVDLGRCLHRNGFGNLFSLLGITVFLTVKRGYSNARMPIEKKLVESVYSVFVSLWCDIYENE